MIKKEVFKGLLVGLIANIIGLYLATIMLGNGDDFITVLKSASAEGFLGKLISLGSILNLIAFFVFSKKYNLVAIIFSCFVQMVFTNKKFTP